MPRHVVVATIANCRLGVSETVPFYADTALRAQLLYGVLCAAQNQGHIEFREASVADAQVVYVLKPYAEG